MSAREYERKMIEAMEVIMTENGIDEYKSVCLSADRTEYEVTFKDGSTKIVPSGFEYFED